MGGEGADGGAGDEAEAEGGADEAHGLGAFGARGDVGDGGGGDGEIAAEGAADEAGEQEEPKRAAERPEQVTEGGAGDGPAQDVAAAEAVAEAAPEGGEDKLENGKDGADHAAEEDGGEVAVFAEGAGDGIEVGEEPAEDAVMAFETEVVGEEVGPEGEDDREADQIDVEGEKDDAERELARGRGGSGGDGGGGHGGAGDESRSAPGRQGANGSSFGGAGDDAGVLRARARCGVFVVSRAPMRSERRRMRRSSAAGGRAARPAMRTRRCNAREGAWVRWSRVSASRARRRNVLPVTLRTRPLPH